MGELIGKKIVQTRTYIDPDLEPVKNFDYYETYPISVYEAIKRTNDENSPNLVDEFNAVNIKINARQPKIPANISGSIITYEDEDGEIGKRDVVNTISSINPSARNIPSELAVKLLGDTKPDNGEFYEHIDNQLIHVSPDDRIRWDSAAPLDLVIEHIGNDDIHVTIEDKANWNSKADGDDFEDHITDYNNPHRVTTGQINTYNRPEIDALIKAAQTNFFNYLNILWDQRTGEVKLVRYNPTNWDPNYVLQYNDDLPQVEDHDKTYFALKPRTDHTIDNSNDIVIYIKDPIYFPTWTEVAVQTLDVGDLLVRYPDGALFMWLLGHFVEILTRDGGLIPGDFLTEVSRDATLIGNGTLNSPLGIPLNSIGSTLIKSASINKTHIVGKSLVGANIADDTIALNNLSPDIRILLSGIGSVTIPPGSITQQHLAVGSVTNAKILDGNISTNKLADTSVTTAKIKNNAIVGAKIAQDVITHAHLTPTLRNQIIAIGEMELTTRVVRDITVWASDWISINGIYAQTIQVSDMVDQWPVSISQKFTNENRDRKVLLHDEFLKISHNETLNGSLWLECWHSAPIEDLQLTLVYDK